MQPVDEKEGAGEQIPFSHFLCQTRDCCETETESVPAAWAAPCHLPRAAGPLYLQGERAQQLGKQQTPGGFPKPLDGF